MLKSDNAPAAGAEGRRGRPRRSPTPASRRVRSPSRRATMSAITDVSVMIPKPPICTRASTTTCPKTENVDGEVDRDRDPVTQTADVAVKRAVRNPTPPAPVLGGRQREQHRADRRCAHANDERDRPVEGWRRRRSSTGEAYHAARRARRPRKRAGRWRRLATADTRLAGAAGRAKSEDVTNCADARSHGTATRSSPRWPSCSSAGLARTLRRLGPAAAGDVGAPRRRRRRSGRRCSDGSTCRSTLPARRCC